MQIIWGDTLQERAIDQWTREIPIIASRGKITDCNGVVLANNDDTYTVFVRKKAVDNLERTVQSISEILDIEYSTVYDRLTRTYSSEVTIKKQVDKTKINELLSKNLSGVYYSRDNSRVYPYNQLLSSVIGFTSNDGKGQSGLELYYDKYMSGVNGEILYETDIVGVEVDNGKATYLPAIDGLNIRLTIDYEIQQLCEVVTEEAMQVNGAKSAQVIVIDPNTGAIKAMSTRPSYNLNDIDRSDVNLLFSLSRNGLISDMYEPGSTFKIITAIANIQEYLNGNPKAYSPEHIFSSARYRYIDGQRVKCWNNHANGKHSNLNLQGALNNSCNPIFVDIAYSLGKETIYKYIDMFNFGTVTGIDFKGESQGMVLPVSCIQNVDLARIAFGQTIAVTPLQLVYATAAAVNGGDYYTPRLVSEIYDNSGNVAEIIQPEVKRKTVDKRASEILSSMLEDVVTNGSGKQAYIEGYRVAGKTGDILTTCVNLVKNLIKIYT